MSDPSRRLRIVKPTTTQVEMVAYAPTEFYHCQHCEIVWGQIGFGRKLHAEERKTALPDDLQAEYAAISAWVREAFDRYGERLTVRVTDAASLQGFFKAIRYRAHRFPAFIIDGRDRIIGFDRRRLDAALRSRLGDGEGGERLANTRA
jgi:hypothetical protein